MVTKVPYEDSTALLVFLKYGPVLPSDPNLVLVANYNDLSGNSLNLDFSRDGGSLVCSGVGNPLISSVPKFGIGALDLSGVAHKHVDYSGSNLVDSLIQTGCIEFWFCPGYSGAPQDSGLSVQAILHINSSTVGNGIIFYHHQAGSLVFQILDSTSVSIQTIGGSFLPTANTWYHIEVNWDVTAGAIRLFVNGVQLGTTGTNTGTRSSDIGLMRVGDVLGAGYGYINDFKIDALSMYDSVQHTSGFTPPTSEKAAAVFAFNIKSGEEARITFPSSVGVPYGQQSTNFDITWASAGTTILQAQLIELDGSPTSGAIFDHDIECLAAPESVLVKLSPDSVTIEETLTGPDVEFTVVLSNPVVDTPKTVSLLSSDTGVMTVPVSVNIAVGENSATFLGSPIGFGTATISATLDVVIKQANVTVSRIPFIALASEDFDVVVGGDIDLLVTFSNPVVRDEVVTTESSNPSLATVPVSVTVLTGDTSASVLVAGIATGGVVITATHPTATKQSNGQVLAAGVGLPTGHYRPSPYRADDLRPTPLSAEEE